MFRPLLLLALTRGQEVEIQSLEELNIEDIDENGADFAVLGDTSHIDHREIDEGSREARGWGEQHDWVTLLDAMIEGSEYKPIMLILFDRNCHADIHCDSLQKEFVSNSEIDLLSTHFHMVNLMGIQEHNQHFDDMVTSPWYLPRIFFLEDNGDIIKWAHNRLRKDDKEYYYNHASEIVKTMHDVLGAYTRRAAHDEL